MPTLALPMLLAYVKPCNEQQPRAGRPRCRAVARCCPVLCPRRRCWAHDIVDAGARFVHQRRAERARPVQHAVLRTGRVKKVLYISGNELMVGIVLAAVGITSGEIVLGIDLPIHLDIALIGIDD